MTHVRAIRKVVRPELARKKLQKKRWLIRCLARGIKACLVWRIETIQLLRDHRKGVCPQNRLIVGGVGTPHHRSRKTALLIQPVIRLSRQLLNRIPREELRRHPLPGRLIRYCFCAILAELEGLTVFVGTWLGTALTSESGDLVNLQECLWVPHHAHIANPIKHRDPDRRTTRRFFRGRSYFHLAERCRILRLQGDCGVRIELLFRAILAHYHLKQVFLHTVMPVSALIISLDHGGAVEYLHGRSLPFSIDH